jgi:hypothetical protein
MSGASIVGNLLVADGPTTAKVPAQGIKLGALPDGVALPALLVRTISTIERQPLSVGSMVRVTERVSVTVRAASYRDQVAVMKLVRTCCRGRTGDIGGGTGVAITTSPGGGPDLLGPGDTFEQAQDFRVSFDEPA